MKILNKDWKGALNSAREPAMAFAKNVGASAAVGGFTGGAIDASMGSDSSILDGVYKGAVGGALLGAAGTGYNAYKVSSKLNRKHNIQPIERFSAEQVAAREPLLEKQQNLSAKNRRDLSDFKERGRGLKFTTSEHPLDKVVDTSHLSLMPDPEPVIPGGIGFKTPDSMLNRHAATVARQRGFGW